MAGYSRQHMDNSSSCIWNITNTLLSILNPLAYNHAPRFFLCCSISPCIGLRSGTFTDHEITPLYEPDWGFSPSWCDPRQYGLFISSLETAPSKSIIRHMRNAKWKCNTMKIQNLSNLTEGLPLCNVITCHMNVYPKARDHTKRIKHTPIEEHITTMKILSLLNLIEVFSFE